MAASGPQSPLFPSNLAMCFWSFKAGFYCHLSPKVWSEKLCKSSLNLWSLYSTSCVTFFLKIAWTFPPLLFSSNWLLLWSHKLFDLLIAFLLCLQLPIEIWLKLRHASSTLLNSLINHPCSCWRHGQSLLELGPACKTATLIPIVMTKAYLGAILWELYGNCYDQNKAHSLR